MLQKVVEFPSQLSLSSNISETPFFASLSGRISSILITGMGASGLVGDFVKVLMRRSNTPVFVHKNGSLPAFVNEETLVISVTYSGKTKETLDNLSSSIDRGAKNLVITSLFELGSACSRKGIPWIKVPENGFPRAALGFMLISVMSALRRLGLADSFDIDIEETVTLLREVRAQCGPETPQRSNPARLLAHALVGRFPIIYSESGFTDVVALRWKQQMNENGKIHCYQEVFPELLHNEIESWHLSDNAHVKEYAVLLLRDTIWERECGMEARIEATKRLAEAKGARIFELWTRGESELARLLSLCYIGDFVSVYLALSKGIDPGPVQNIEQMKKVSISGSKES